MTVKKIVRKTEKPVEDQVEKPMPAAVETRKPIPDVERSSPNETRPESDGFNDAIGGSGRMLFEEFGKTSALGSVDLKRSVILPSKSFSPLKYGSFSVPSVSTEFYSTGKTDDEIIADYEVVADRLFGIQRNLFVKALEVYFEEAEIAYREAAQRIGV